ncbi:MAG: transposase [Candidatus Paceibacterota bacterium]
MPRSPRVDVKDYYYHVINRASARLTLFESKKDYSLFEAVLTEAVKKFDMRVIAYCCMPNHFHLLLQPKNDGDLSMFMYWFTMTFTSRWHAIKHTTGSGHIFQGRFKSFLVQNDPHLLTVIRYIERNPLRAGLVKKSERWRYSSLYRRLFGTPKQKKVITEPEVQLPADYLSFVNEPLSESELQAVRRCTKKCMPYGSNPWRDRMVDRFRLQATLREKGRPRKSS